MDKDVFNMDDRLFIRGKNGELYEGPLGDKANNIKLLFVMKEPNGERLECFWMKDKVITKEEGTRYYNVLGAFAKSFLKTSHHDALMQIAYINLYPFKGCGTSKRDNEEKSYLDLMDTWEQYKDSNTLLDLDSADIIEFSSSHEEILCNRIKIIKNALDNGISVVAFYDIANNLYFDKNFKGLFQREQSKREYPYFPIISYIYYNGAKLYGIPHLNRRYSYQKLKDNLEITSVYPE